MTKKYKQRHDGETIPIELHHVKGLRKREKGALHKISCCDCGLVHLFHFRVYKNVLYIEAYRDNRATGQVRRHKEKP